jgi:quercetin dioxygenase-like cupin family protein
MCISGPTGYGRDGMARSGDVLNDLTSGRRLVFRRTSAQTGGRLAEYAVQYGRDEPQPVPHVEADREHLVEVLRGHLTASLSGRIQRLGPGDVLLIRTGEPHAVWNAFDAAAEAVWQTYPALDTESQLETRYQK